MTDYLTTGGIFTGLNIRERLSWEMNKNECSIAATGPPSFEGPRENPKSLSSPIAKKFEFLLMHSVYFQKMESQTTNIETTYFIYDVIEYILQ